MTKEEKICFEYGKTFAPKDGKDAPCYDDRMRKMVSETRTEKGHARNIKNMQAWREGRKAVN